MNIKFKALEYTADDCFETAEYEFEGHVKSGWAIRRNHQAYLTLGKGYELLKTRLCGICGTDLNRRFLPFPLPQIIGHEAVVERMSSGEKCVVEINDTPHFRGDAVQDIFCEAGLPTHTPGRMVLGIDRLPGGFGPYLLAPKQSINRIDDLNESAAVLVEPFAAAVQAVVSSPPLNNERVAVLGPRRLGALLIAALSAFRRMSGNKFEIHALTRHNQLLNLCHQLGADDGINLAETDEHTLHRRYDIIYDTTGSASGFELALKLAKREIHLKSTNGQKVCGLDQLTAFVVDELSMLPFTDQNLDFTWAIEKRKNKTVYIAPGVKEISIKGKTHHKGDPLSARGILKSTEFERKLPRFDVAVASTLEEIDSIIRPMPDDENALVRPRGTILFKGDPSKNQLLSFIKQGGALRSSRCGDFQLAIKLLRENKDIAENLSHYMISHVFPASEIETAFQYARRREAIKVVVKHFYFADS